jgi:tRNA (uracil-5-)-methyltransferase TRM9
MNDRAKQQLLGIVKRNYDEIASDFSESRRKYLWPELARLAEDVGNGDAVLDLGCGNGRLYLAFSDKEIEYVGIDNSAKLIAKADEEYKNPQTHFFIGDILRLDEISVLKNKQFDHIFMVAVLHHIPSKELRIKALKQMKEKLRSNGRIVITVWNMWAQARYRKEIAKFAFKKVIGKNGYDFGDILFGWGENKASQRYYHAFRLKELEDTVLQSGLQIIKLYKDKRNYYLAATL